MILYMYIYSHSRVNVCHYRTTVYPKKYAHGFVVLCFVVAMQSFIINSHEVFIHIHQGCFAGTGAIVRLPQCQWSMPDGYGKISQCITTTKHSKAKTVCIFLGINCIWHISRLDIFQKDNSDRLTLNRRNLADLFRRIVLHSQYDLLSNVTIPLTLVPVLSWCP